jgi:hypothetical protein
MHIPISIKMKEKKIIETKGLIDCGVEGDFIDKEYTARN